MTNSKTADHVQELEDYFARRELAKAPAWRPEPKTTVVGTVIALTMRDSGYGLYPVVSYKGDDGTVFAVHAFHTLLRQMLAELKTEIGSKQIITYEGKRQKTNPTEEEIKKGLDSYHDYYVENWSGPSQDDKAENFTWEV